MAISEISLHRHYASAQEMAHTSWAIAEQAVAAEKKYTQVLASENGGMMLAMCIGTALGIDAQTLRLDRSYAGASMPVIRQIDVPKHEYGSTIIAAPLLDETNAALLEKIIPGADIAANYSALDEVRTGEIAVYCGKIIQPRLEGKGIFVDFWFDRLRPEEVIPES